MEKFGCPLWEVNAVKDAESGVRAMAASVEAKGGSRFHGNWKETDQFLMRSNLPAIDKDREALDRPGPYVKRAYPNRPNVSSLGSVRFVLLNRQLRAQRTCDRFESDSTIEERFSREAA